MVIKIMDFVIPAAELGIFVYAVVVVHQLVNSSG